MNGRQYSSLWRVYHGRYWGCQSTWKLICERIRAARVPPFSPSALHRSSLLRESSKARKRAFISEDQRRRVVLRARVALDSNPPSFWHEARCFRVLRSSFARACSTRLFALPQSCFEPCPDKIKRINSEFSLYSFWSTKLELLVILSLLSLSLSL